MRHTRRGFRSRQSDEYISLADAAEQWQVPGGSKKCEGGVLARSIAASQNQPAIVVEVRHCFTTITSPLFVSHFKANTSSTLHAIMQYLRPDCIPNSR
ncbi:hypothetical protein E2C01_068719 [Portunus trituberculatus]|uniref:Uncharacterized protein n=1 Tax=Portunus trituberculatus TaxID=210409 RepID=A0A5B7HSR2_PORTR|nr:hypothetical protein [Portunus trituberculatus]